MYDGADGKTEHTVTETRCFTYTTLSYSHEDDGPGGHGNTPQ